MGSVYKMAFSALWPCHAVFMTLGFILMTTRMLIARYLKTREWWLKAHRPIEMVGAIFAIAGLSMVIYRVSVSTGQHFAVPHTYVGALTITFIILTPVLGYAQFTVASKRETISYLSSLVGPYYVSFDARYHAFRLCSSGGALMYWAVTKRRDRIPNVSDSSKICERNHSEIVRN